MLKNFIKTAIRNILKYKAFSIINFVGLTCGMALSLLILAYLRHELSYDRFHEKTDRLYRLSYGVPNGMQLAVTPPPIAPLMPEYFPGVEKAARLYPRNISIAYPDKPLTDSFEETDVIFADSAITDLFSFTFLSGNPKTALREKFTLLITDEMAKKYFGDKDPLGESLILGGKQSFKIVGVVKNLPENSHLRFHMLVPYDDMYDMETDDGEVIMRRNLAVNFVISHSYTYVLLKPGASPTDVDKAMPDFLKKYCQPRLLVGQVFTLMPLKNIHLYSTLQGEPTPTNSLANLYIFGGVGILTLLIACINYINLSTAQSFTRIKEIGIRKILGSERSQLITQFMAESFLFCLIAFVVSYVVFYLSLPLLNQVTSKHLAFGDLVDGFLIGSSLVLLIVVTLMAGGYPAYFVAQFDSVSSLKGSGDNLSGSKLFRKALVVFQLAIACLLLSGSMMLIKQLDYLSNRPLGFKKEQVISIPLFSQNLNSIFSGADSSYRARLQTFRDRVESEADVNLTTASSGAPGTGAIYRGAIPEGFSQSDNMFIANLAIDQNFLKGFEIPVVAGRGFSKEFPSDQKESFIVNETAVKEFHWETPEKAIGKTMNREGKKGTVIGVVKDFNEESLTTPMSALILEFNPAQWNSLSIRVNSGQADEVVERLKKEWVDLFPEKTFEFVYLDEQLKQQYSTYQSFGKIIEGFTSIAVLISCLGVYGLVLFIVQRKVKEIGVRKVLGASVTGILKLIYSDFAILLVIGFVVAAPMSYYLIRQWLENFAFHTDIDVITYVISFTVVLMIVTVTISYHAVKAAMANPVQSLRTE